MPNKIIIEGEVNSTGAAKGGPEVESSEKLSAREFDSEPCHRIIGVGMTLNLGSYESLKVYSEVKMVCTKEELPTIIDEAYDHAKEALDVITMRALEARGKKR